MEKKILEILNHILLAKKQKELVSLDLKLDLRNDLGFDSLDLAELTVRIEREFGVDIFEDGVVVTIGEIVKILGDKNGKR